MWSFLLLLLSLMTGYEAISEVWGCQGGWVEFTCKCPKPQRKYISIVLDSPRTNIHIIEKDLKTEGSISLYHDRKSKELKVAIKQLQREDFGQYKCKFYKESKVLLGTEELHLADVKDKCQFIQTAYKTAKTTITCDRPRKKSESDVMFFCKENTNSMCEDILATKSSPKSNMTFSLTENNSSFNMSISNVSPDHAGVYWCGMKSTDGSNRTALRKIQLEVKGIRQFTRSPTVGQNFTYWCEYPSGAPIKKFICKGEDPSICQHLVSTTQLERTTGKFSMKDDKVTANITITVREITTDDAGTYWCGAESSNTKHSNTFFNRFRMTVVPPPPTSPVSSTVTTSTSAESDIPPPPTASASSTVTTSASAESGGGPQVVIIVIVCVAVLLLLVLILSLIYKRFAHSKNTRNGTAAQQIREDYVYEEIQEQRPDSGNRVNAIYATANFPTNPSASLHYSTIKFQNSSDKAGGEALILRPSSSACEYSTVKKSPSPTYYTVNEPSTSSHDPLYSTINKPR